MTASLFKTFPSRWRVTDTISCHLVHICHSHIIVFITDHVYTAVAIPSFTF